MNKVERKTFNQEIKQAVQQLLGEQYVVTLQTVRKTNETLIGLCIKERGCNIAPNIYLDRYYSAYEAGLSIWRLAEDIVEVFKENRPTQNFDSDSFLNFSKVKERIVYKIINKEKNKKLLRDVPYVSFLDLAVVFYVLVEKTQEGTATALIHHSHMASWGVGTEDLFKLATANTKRLFSPEIKSMRQIMREMLVERLLDDTLEEFSAEELDEIFGMEDAEDEFPMYVLSNDSKLNGSATILYEGVLSKFADEQKSDLWLLPSSVHEWILIPAKVYRSAKELTEMVQEVNKTQLAVGEMLSDHAYYYNRMEGKVLTV